MTPHEAYFYARDIIQGQWPEAEPFILQSRLAENYCKEFLLRFQINWQIEGF